MKPIFSKALLPTIINDKLRKKHVNEEKTAIIIHTIKSFCNEMLEAMEMRKIMKEIESEKHI